MKINKLIKKQNKLEHKIRVRWNNQLAEKKKQKEKALENNIVPKETIVIQTLFNEMIYTIEEIQKDLISPDKHLYRKYCELYEVEKEKIDGKESEEIEQNPLLTLAFNKTLFYAQIKEDLLEFF